MFNGVGSVLTPQVQVAPWPRKGEMFFLCSLDLTPPAPVGDCQTVLPLWSITNASAVKIVFVYECGINKREKCLCEGSCNEHPVCYVYFMGLAWVLQVRITLSPGPAVL